LDIPTSTNSEQVKIYPGSELAWGTYTKHDEKLQAPVHPGKLASKKLEINNFGNIILSLHWLWVL
jgi:hypothetical protein